MPRRIKRAVAILAGGVLLAAGILYLQASRDPPGYHPAVLETRQKAEMGKEFVNLALAIQTSEKSDRDLHSWELTEGRINEYLAAVDEIAFLGEPVFREKRTRGDVDRAMKRAGIGGVAVAVNEGGLTLMVQSLRYGKVISADVSVTMTAEKELAARLIGARVGRLAVPVSLLRERLGRLGAALAPPGSKGADRTAETINAVLAGRRIRPRWTADGREIWLEDIRLLPGRMKLVFSRGPEKDNGD